MSGWRVAVALVATAAIVGAGVAEDHREKAAWSRRNVDPRMGRVLIDPNGARWKVCYGTTLVYWSKVRGGTTSSTVPDSPECAR